MKHYILIIFLVCSVTFGLNADFLEIRCDQPILIRNDHVGNEWVFDFQVGKERFPFDEAVQIEVPGKIRLQFSATEIDKYSDFGRKDLEIDIFSLNLNQEYFSEIDVVVIEDRGRYAGNRAAWRFTVYYTRWEGLPS